MYIAAAVVLYNSYKYGNHYWYEALKNEKPKNVILKISQKNKNHSRNLKPVDVKSLS